MTAPPRVSVGLPVRNGEQFIGRAIESVLAQDFADFELVICDNDSTDSTLEIVRQHAKRDPRVKLHENGRDIGQIENMNRVFELASGEFFRWTGADDWFEPTYLSRCVEALDADPDLIGVSTYINYFDDAGNQYYEEYTGERFESDDPARRFARMLWFFHADYRYCDPHYTMYRRSALEQTRLYQLTMCTDHILATEIALLGRAGHVPECLFHRRREPAYYDEEAVLEQQYDPSAPEKLRLTVAQLCAKYDESVRAASLTPMQRLVCRRAIARYYLEEQVTIYGDKGRNLLRRLPGFKLLKAALGR